MYIFLSSNDIQSLNNICLFFSRDLSKISDIAVITIIFFAQLFLACHYREYYEGSRSQRGWNIRASQRSILLRCPHNEIINRKLSTHSLCILSSSVPFFALSKPSPSRRNGAVGWGWSQMKTLSSPLVDACCYNICLLVDSGVIRVAQRLTLLSWNKSEQESRRKWTHAHVCNDKETNVEKERKGDRQETSRALQLLCIGARTRYSHVKIYLLPPSIVRLLPSHFFFL